MAITRRQALASFAALAAARCTTPSSGAPAVPAEPAGPTPLALANGDVNWHAVRDLFPLSKDWMHFAGFLIASHPKPVSERIAKFRAKLDEDPTWLDRAAFDESEGHPFNDVKQALAQYIGGDARQICITQNTTTGLAMVYHGLRLRAGQQVLTTEHDHYSHHESIRYAAGRTGATVRYVALYDSGASANAAEMTERLERAITPSTRAVGVTWVHSSTGVKTPIAAMAEAVGRANRGRAAADRCLLIVDGVHGFANQDVDVARLGCDFFAAGTHKWLFGPRGTGFLWGRSEVWPELTPTIPSFDPDVEQPMAAWMARSPLPPTEAGFVSPGGFVAYEHLLSVPAAVELHRTIGRDKIAARIRELNTAFREGAAGIAGVTLHTPRDPEVSGGISCFEVAGLKPDEVVARLAEKKMRTTTSPYKVSYARVSAGIANFPEEIDAVLREIRTLAGKRPAA